MSERFSSSERSTENPAEQGAERLRAKEAWDTLRAGEQNLCNEYGNTLMEAVKTGHHEKGRVLAAALVFFSGTTAGAEPDTLRAESENPSYEMVEPNPNPSPSYVFQGIALPFDWRDMARALSNRESAEDEARVETITIPKIPTVEDSVMTSSFYKDLTPLSYGKALWSTGDAIRTSRGKGYESFINHLKRAELSDNEKLVSLQYLGFNLLQTYNTDMADNNQYIKISEDDMLLGIQTYYAKKPWEKIQPTGICGNIHAFLTETANNIGIDSWLQMGIVRGYSAPGHTWMGLIAKDGAGKDQIAFLNYDTLVPTGTMDYRLALGVSERYFKQISLFESYISTTEEVIGPRKSLAQEAMSEAADITGAEKILENSLYGKNDIPESAVSISDRTTRMQFTGDTLGFAFTHMENKDNPYQALETMDAARGSLYFGNEMIGGNMEVTRLHLNIKDLGSGVIAQDEVIGKIERHFINTHSFTKEQFGTFILRYGLTIENAFRYILNADIPATENSERARGAAIIYTDPSKTGTFYIGSAETYIIQKTNPETQTTGETRMSENLTAGANIAVREGTVLNLETRATALNYGDKQEMKAGISGRDKILRVETEKTTSDIPHAIPSTEKLSVEAGYTFGKKPLAEAVVFGAKENIDYTTASGEKSEIGVKMRILFW